jgi:putative phosphoesterase
MRLVVVSDVHGNLTALEAVIEDIARRGVDRVVHGGDLALAGPRPGEVIDRIRELGWPGVVGNTDELLWRPQEHARQRDRAPQLRTLLRWLFDAYAPYTIEQIGEERLAWLHDLPAELRIDGIAIVHAAPGDLWRAPMPDASNRDLDATYRPIGAGTVAYGHIHRPFVRVIEDLVVVNAGSAGMPWDDDPRASYLLLEDGRVEVIRVDYDIDAEARESELRAHPDSERLAEMRRLGRFIAPNPFPESPPL